MKFDAEMPYFEGKRYKTNDFFIFLLKDLNNFFVFTDKRRQCLWLLKLI